MCESQLFFDTAVCFSSGLTSASLAHTIILWISQVERYNSVEEQTMATEMKWPTEDEKALGDSEPQQVETHYLDDADKFLAATDELLNYLQQQEEKLGHEQFGKWLIESHEGKRCTKSFPVVKAGLALLQARLQVDKGAWQLGLEKLHSALDIFRRIEDIQGKAEVFLAIGDVHQKFGDYEIARMSYRDAERHFRQAGNKTGEMMAQLKKGTVELQLQNIATARVHIEAASNYFHAAGDEERAKLSDEWLALVQRVEQGASQEIPA